MTLHCSNCGDELSRAFHGKAQSRGWDEDNLRCPSCFEKGTHLIPTEG